MIFYAVSFKNTHKSTVHYFDTLRSAIEYARFLPNLKSSVRTVCA